MHTTTGVLANAPSVRVTGIRSGTVQATPRREIFALVMPLATSRVFARLPPGSDHPAATAGFPRTAGAGAPEPVAVPADEPVEQANGFAVEDVPHPPTAAIAPTAKQMHVLVDRQRIPVATAPMSDRLLPACGDPHRQRKDPHQIP